MLTLTHTPSSRNTIKLAFSGGVDSLTAAHFWRRKKNVTLCHFNHGCEYSNQIEEECRQRADDLGMPITVGHIKGECAPGQSLEDFWRRQRYAFLYSESGNDVVTVHHLNDTIETWVWSSLHGEPKLISPSQDIEYKGKNNTLHRPFLLTPKRNLVSYAERHGLVPVTDPYNDDLHLTRNYIRTNVMPHVLKVNPGIEKVIRKKMLALVPK